MYYIQYLKESSLGAVEYARPSQVNTKGLYVFLLLIAAAFAIFGSRTEAKNYEFQIDVQL